MTLCYPHFFTHTFYLQAHKKEKLNDATKAHSIYCDELKLSTKLLRSTVKVGRRSENTSKVFRN